MTLLSNILDKNTLFYNALSPQSQVQVEAEFPALCLLLLFLINIWFFRPNHGGINKPNISHCCVNWVCWWNKYYFFLFFYLRSWGCLCFLRRCRGRGAWSAGRPARSCAPTARDRGTCVHPDKGLQGGGES